MPFVCATRASFSYGAIRGEAEAEGLGDDVASPHPSKMGGDEGSNPPSSTQRAFASGVLLSHGGCATVTMMIYLQWVVSQWVS